MRTTLTLEEDVVRLIKEATIRERRGFKEVVNSALRRGLAPAAERRKRKVYKVTPYPSKLRGGIDSAKLNQLLDEIDDDAFLTRAQKR